MMNLDSLKKQIEQSSIIQMCEDHAKPGCVVVYDRMVTGNKCPLCDTIEGLEKDIETLGEEEETERSRAFEAEERVSTLEVMLEKHGYTFGFTDAEKANDYTALYNAYQQYKETKNNG